MMTIAEKVNELIEPVEEITDDTNTVSLSISKVQLDLPVQLQIAVSDSGDVVIGTSPPLYQIETSFMPAFHQLRFTFEKTD